MSLCGGPIPPLDTPKSNVKMRRSLSDGRVVAVAVPEEAGKSRSLSFTDAPKTDKTETSRTLVRTIWWSAQ